MQLKSYNAGSMRDVMRLVRDDLGDDAVIVSAVEDEGGVVRVTAALEKPEWAPEPDRGSQAEPPTARADAGRDGADVLAAVLDYHGVVASLSDRLIRRARAVGAGDPGLALGAALDETFRFSPIPSRDVARPLMLVGPAGTGKTLTTAKLAARLVLQGLEATVVNADVSRAAAADQLAALTTILGVGLATAATPEDLARAVAPDGRGQAAFIDSFAVNPFDRAEVAHLGEFVDAADAEPVLVLAAGIDALEAAEIAEAFAGLGTTRMITTRIDQSRRLGSLLTAAAAGGLAIADAGVTAHVAHGLTALNPVSLARVLCRDPRIGQRPTRPSRGLRMTKRPSPARHPASPRLGDNVVAIASGKGGVGKTWFSITLAQALARAGGRVLLFDGDLGLANIDIQLGLTGKRDLGDVIAGKMTLRDAVSKYAAGKFDIVAGRSGSGGIANLPAKRIAELRHQLFQLATQYNSALIDMGAGVDQPVQTLLAGAKTCLVLTTPDPTALTDAYAFIKVSTTAQPDMNVRIVVNGATTRPEGLQTYGTLRKACETFLGLDPVLAGIIRQDAHVVDCIRSQTPLLTRHPNSEAAGDVQAIADTLLVAA